MKIVVTVVALGVAVNFMAAAQTRSADRGSVQESSGASPIKVVQNAVNLSPNSVPDSVSDMKILDTARDPSTDLSDDNFRFIYPAGENCCDCPPTASDQQCFAQCNAIIPRCRPAAARPSRPPAPVHSRTSRCTSALTGFCCAGNLRYYSAPSQGLICPGDPCYLMVRRWPNYLRYSGRGCW